MYVTYRAIKNNSATELALHVADHTARDLEFLEKYQHVYLEALQDFRFLASVWLMAVLFRMLILLKYR
ncbi:hypothetical protein XELAEV_18028072mg [Xenopus laevis]|uniref:Uncharacterized protein n=1 Tax=Xenopus laevis TaxID=8355 RepID=A0A974CZ04_XENLA|nr:hypothetical protein XELAEV_18028072mg [Xenopus laevis]